MKRLILAILVLLLSDQSASGFQDVLSIEFSGEVSRWSLANDSQIYQTPGPSDGFGGLAQLNDGRLLTVRTIYGGNSAALFELDPNTGTQTLIGNLGVDPTKIVALAGTADGKLLGFNSDIANPEYYEIDPITLQSEIITIQYSNGSTSAFLSSMATAPDGRIFGWVGGSAPGEGVFNKLFEIDPTLETATEIGGFEHVGSTDSLTLAFTKSGQLFGFSEINGGSNNGSLVPDAIYEFDMNSGFPSFVRFGNGAYLSGISGALILEPIPEPSCLGLTVLLTLVCLNRRAVGQFCSNRLTLCGN